MIAPNSIPALIALAFKLLLFVYALKAPARNLTTKLYFTLLVLLTILNLVEFTGLNRLAKYGLDPTMELIGFAYFFIVIPFVAVVLHISLRLSFDDLAKQRLSIWLLYLPIIPLEFSLMFSDKLVQGFQLFQGTLLRRPGEWYSLFETYAVIYMSAAMINLFYGARIQRRPTISRTRNRLWLLALSPIALLYLYLIVANHFGLAKITSTVYLPIAISFFLVITTYATYQYRLFDIEFFIPWSKVRKRKTVFYDRIRAIIGELADLPSIHEVIERFAGVLQTPVALVSADRPVVAPIRGSRRMTNIPRKELKKFEQIVVTNEIVDTWPDLHATMKQHGIGAVVPFLASGKNAAGWLLLGEPFSEQVHTPLDFRVLENLFGKMADLFLEQLLTLRNQVTDQQTRFEQLEAELKTAKEHLAQLQEENSHLSQFQPLDNMITAVPQAQVAQSSLSITFLGHNKSFRSSLRRHFPQLISYVGLQSRSFWKMPLPDLLVCQLDDAAPVLQQKLLKLLERHRGDMAALLIGSLATDFVKQHRRQLAGSLLEVVANTADDEIMVRKIHSLYQLKKSTFFISDGNYPLIGQSEVFLKLMQDIHSIAQLSEPVIIKSRNPDEVANLSAYLHQLGERPGGLHRLSATKLYPGNRLDHDYLDSLLANARGGTLVVENICELRTDQCRALLERFRQAQDIRLVIGCYSRAPQFSSLHVTLQPLVLAPPMLKSRTQDLPLLAQYYILQFNTQSGDSRSMTKAEFDGLIANSTPENLAALKLSVINLLINKDLSRSAEANNLCASLHGTQGETLDKQLAEIEKHIIQGALDRCGGNKSKAARLLGLRPNTLHYKLERYGILEK